MITENFKKILKKSTKKLFGWFQACLILLHCDPTYGQSIEKRGGVIKQRTKIKEKNLLCTAMLVSLLTDLPSAFEGPVNVI